MSRHANISCDEILYNLFFDNDQVVVAGDRDVYIYTTKQLEDKRIGIGV